jgi:hypothetical protein
MRTIRWFVFAAISIILFLGIYLACSDSPVLTTAPGEGEGAISLSTERSAHGGVRGLWGFYNVALYPAERRAEIIPLRTAMLNINAIIFMHGADGGLSGLEIEIIDYEDLGITGDCTVGVTLKHPYPELLEFCGFDVMGLFMGNGSDQGVEDSSLIFPVVGEDPVLMNADGYSRWMNPTEFSDDAPWGYFDPLSDENSGFIASATINAYKYFTEGIEPDEVVADFFEDPVNCAQRGLFSSGAECTRNYEIRFPLVGGEPVILFNYAVLASWAEPMPSPPQHIPEDFPVAANANYPIHANLIDYSTLYYRSDMNRGGDIISTSKMISPPRFI